MGDPGLLQKSPDITSLLSQGGDHREQQVAGLRSGGGLSAKAVARPIPDLAVNQRLPERLPSHVDGGLDQIDRPQQRGLELPADRPASLLSLQHQQGMADPAADAGALR